MTQENLRWRRMQWTWGGQGRPEEKLLLSRFISSTELHLGISFRGLMQTCLLVKAVFGIGGYLRVNA